MNYQWAPRAIQWPRYGLRPWIMSLLVVGVGACDRDKQSSAAPADVAKQVPTTRAASKEPWVDQPTSTWPQFVLTNLASFTGHSGLRGASGFLVRVPDGRVLGATAKHLIGNAGGVTPPVPLAELGGALKSWAMFPRTDVHRVVFMNRPAIKVEQESNHDWLLMTLKKIEKMPLPAQPLRRTRCSLPRGAWLISRN